MKRKFASDRRKLSAVAVVGIAASAVLFAASGSAGPLAAGGDRAAVVAAALKIVAPPPAVGQRSTVFGPGEMVAASRSSWRVVPRELPVGLAPERGLQVKTILVNRTVSELFPEIRNIGGVRADALRWHPNGLALDVMIPNYGSAEGIALGDAIVAFALKNAERFALQGARPASV